MRDLGTETHFEYGSRAGVWRLARLFDRYGIPVTVSACAIALERNPAVVDWMNARGHDLLGHGLRWHEYSATAPRGGGARPSRGHRLYERLPASGRSAGIAAPFPASTRATCWSREGGFLYHSDPCNDDLPYFTDHGARAFLIVPYSKTLNDSRYLIAPGYGNPRDFAEDCRSAIDYLLDEADETGGRMLTIGLHASWSGQPNRASGARDLIDHVLDTPGVGFMRRLDIARFWLANYPSFPREA